ncbi:hypothetical protein REPUB_Repub04eG0178300 [Reevesia pubescens]
MKDALIHQVLGFHFSVADKVYIEIIAILGSEESIFLQTRWTSVDSIGVDLVPCLLGALTDFDELTQAAQIQKFALRFSKLHEAESFMNALKENLKGEVEIEHLNIDFGSEFSTQSEKRQRVEERDASEGQEALSSEVILNEILGTKSGHVRGRGSRHKATRIGTSTSESLLVTQLQTTFEEYSKMVYLDAEIQVYDNIDYLFDTANGYFYAVKDCFFEKIWSHSFQYSIGYCQQCPDKVTWPAEMGSPPPLYFNASMFVFEPCRFTYEKLLETLHITPPTPFAEQSCLFSNYCLLLIANCQDFLNMFFQKVYKPIPAVYNLVLAMLWRHPQNVEELDKIKVVHYCAAVSILLPLNSLLFNL